MFKKICVFAALASLSACVLTDNEAIDDIWIGMSVPQAEAVLGKPVLVRSLRTVEGTTPAKNIARECRTYRYVVRDEDEAQRQDRFTWVTYSAGRISSFSDNGSATGNGDGAYCHG